MTHISKTVDQTAISLPVHLNVNKTEDVTTKKISRLMLELFEALLPTLQKLGASAREFGAQNRKFFLDSSTVEVSQRNKLGFAHLLGAFGAIPSLTRGQIDAVGAASSSVKGFLESHLTSTSTKKEIEKDLISEANQNMSTVESTLEKLLNLVNQIIQSERLTG